MQFLVPAVMMLALVGCATAVPDSGAGVGFDNYDQARLAREADLRGQAAITEPAAPITTATADTTAIATTDQTPATANKPAKVGISDEQSFAAVTGRETIESDRQRLERQAAQYVVIDPKPLPQRAGTSTPSVVDFALSTTNAVGQPLYSRSTFLAAQRYDRNCAKYRSPERAQEDFLRMGGPQKDRRGLDPDGDGFACTWDPAPFRKAVQ